MAWFQRKRGSVQVGVTTSALSPVLQIAVVVRDAPRSRAAALARQLRELLVIPAGERRSLDGVGLYEMPDDRLFTIAVEHPGPAKSARSCQAAVLATVDLFGLPVELLPENNADDAVLDAFAADIEQEQYLRAAAEAGEPSAAYALSERLQRDGRTAEAEQWLLRAGQGHEPNALVSLGVRAYQEGAVAAAEQAWREAARQGHLSGAHNLAVLLEARGADGDAAEAEEMAYAAANAGNPESMQLLARLLERRGAHTVAALWRRRAEAL